MRKLTDEHRRKISEANRGKAKSEEHRRRISEAIRGNPDDLAARAERARQLGVDNVGKKRDPAVVERHRQWMVEHSPNRGVPPSEETRAKLRAANLGNGKNLLKYGITQEQYTAELAAGNRWCFFRRHFAPAAIFTNKTKGVCDGCLREHQRESDLKKKYNITQADYEAMFEAQGRCCAICGSKDPGVRNKHMMIDHNHTTGVVRGILCGPCNTAVERLETIGNWALLAAQYLAKF